MARTVILGNGGHAKAVFHWLAMRPYPVLVENDDYVKPDDIVHIGVGGIATRRRLFEKFESQIPKCGIQLMNGAYEGPGCDVGYNVLINTGAQIDHDCIIGDHCVIAPGAILCGGVKLGEACFIGAGAIIVENVELENETFVPAGTLVTGQTHMYRPQRIVSDGRIETSLAKSGFEPVGEVNREPGGVTYTKPTR